VDLCTVYDRIFDILGIEGLEHLSRIQDMRRLPGHRFSPALMRTEDRFAALQQGRLDIADHGSGSASGEIHRYAAGIARTIQAEQDYASYVRTWADVRSFTQEQGYFWLFGNDLSVAPAIDTARLLDVATASRENFQERVRSHDGSSLSCTVSDVDDYLSDHGTDVRWYRARNVEFISGGYAILWRGRKGRNIGAISVNPYLARPQRRYVRMHELGHLFQFTLLDQHPRYLSVENPPFYSEAFAEAFSMIQNRAVADTWDVIRQEQDIRLDDMIDTLRSIGAEPAGQAPSSLDELYRRMADGVFTIMARRMVRDFLDEGIPLLAAMERRYRADRSRDAIGNAFGTG